MASLRQRKHARTRLALVSALQAALEQQSFTDVPVKSLCHAVEVSEATFFNYFSSKATLLEYAIQFWLLELVGTLERNQTEPGIRSIDQVFTFFAGQAKSRPGFMRAMIGWLANGGVLSSDMVPSALERKLAWPDQDDSPGTGQHTLDAILAQQLQQAINRNQLPANVLIPTVLTGLISILFGVPLVLLSSDTERIGSMYQQQLQIFWSGIRTTSTGSNPG